MDGPLIGVRALDLGQAAVGPVAAEYLGELGADVIKVEPPTGDMVRGLARNARGMSTTFLGNNLTKRGLVLDLKKDADREFAFRLLERTDVVIENFRSPDVLQRLGLGYEVMRSVNPRIIYVQSSAYGPCGPMTGMTSNEWYAQASSGATSVTGAAGGLPEFSRGTAAMDWTGAFVNLAAVLFALYLRERTGRGMRIQTSQFQSAVCASITRMAEYIATGEPPRPLGSARPNIVPDQAFATADGYVTVSCPTNGFWAKLCSALDRPDLRAEPAFADNRSRTANRDRLLSLLEPVFKSQTTAFWLAKFRAADVPAGELQREPTLSASLLANPQVQAEGLMSVLQTPWWPTATAEPHWRFDKTRARISRPSPAIGEHQAEITAEIGVAPARA